MANKWSTVKVEEIAEKIGMGPFGSNIKVKTFVKKGVPIISGAHLHGARVKDHFFNFVSNEHAERLKSSNVFRRDVIFTHAGNIGQVAYIPPNSQYEKYVISQRQFYLRCDLSKAEPAFISYFFHSKEGQHKLLANASQTGVPSIARPSSYLKTIELLLPPLPEQRAIAYILGTLDDKIEQNLRINETLEAIARMLFKAWFVDFEPVHAKMEGRWQRDQSLPGLPAHLYDLFPERLVESELGKIPEGWRTFTLGDLAHQSKGTVNPANSPHDVFKHYSLPAFDTSQTPVIEMGTEIRSNKTLVPDNCILISKLNPHIPRVWHIGKAGLNAVCSTEFTVWTPKSPANSSFLYCLASSVEFNDAMRQLVTGTSNSHQRVMPDQLSDIRVIAASEAAIGKCAAMLMTIKKQVMQHRRQSLALTNLRLTLLPKLISGEIRLQDAERYVEDAKA